MPICHLRSLLNLLQIDRIPFGIQNSVMSRFSVAILSLLLLLNVLFSVNCLGASGSVRVGGYTRKDGTYVAPHYRSAPDGSFYNNWSTKGNVNPYTGTPGTVTTPNGGSNAETLTTITSTSIDTFKSTRKAALEGNPVAQNNLGVMYWKGEVVPIDLKEGVKWFRKAKENGNSYGTFNLGKAYLNGKGVEQDLCLAYNLIHTAAEHGQPAAIQLRSVFQNQLDTMVVAALLKFQSMKELRIAANSGNSEACFLLGEFYIEGSSGLKKDGKAALKWTGQSAAKGNVLAQMNMGWIFENGFGGVTNKQTALEWYMLAAKQNHTEAFNAVGEVYRELPEGLEQSFKWYLKSAEAGNPIGQNNVADCYYYGEGVAKNFESAFV